ncbi:MFS transporter [Microbacterium sp. LWH3-1.2]|uniref:MFS transporter n=1 Tax=Microbacterium sp. LWH3-1.2 TaxID=3135256 RepID=UPI003437D836
MTSSVSERDAAAEREREGPRRRRGRVRPATIWSRGFALILVINLVISIAQYIALAIVPLYASDLGASALVIGVVAGIFAVTALGVRPFVGPATFRFRHSRLLAVTALLILAAFVCYSFADSIAVLVVGRLLHGMGMGLLAPVALMLASNALPSSRMASGIGVFSLGQAVAMAAGPALGIWLIGVLDYRGTFLISGGFIVLALLLSFAVSSPPAQETGPLRITWRRIVAPEALPAAIVMFFLAGAYSAVNSFIVIYAKGAGVADIGFFFTVYAATLLISRPVAGRVADRFGLLSVVVPGMLLFAASFVLIANARTLAEFVLAGVLSAFGYGVCQPAIQSLALLSVSKERRGVAGSTTYMGVDLAYLVMPVVAGWIVSMAHTEDRSGTDAYSVMFVWMLIPIAVALLVYIAVSLRSRSSARKETP